MRPSSFIFMIFMALCITPLGRASADGPASTTPSSELNVQVTLTLHHVVTVGEYTFGLNGPDRGILWARRGDGPWKLDQLFTLQGIVGHRLIKDPTRNELWLIGLKVPAGQESAQSAYARFRPDQNGYNHDTKFWFGAMPNELATLQRSFAPSDSASTIP